MAVKNHGSNIPPIQFSASSLAHIQRATVEVLGRYLDQHDPLDHERRFGTVSGLLRVLEDIGLPYPEDAQGVKQSLMAVKGRVHHFLMQLACAPVANAEEMTFALSLSRRASLLPSILNLRRYTWDLWEIRALNAGVSPNLAEMGRGAFRRQHFCQRPSEEIDPDTMLYIAIADPEQAEGVFMRALFRSPISEFSGTGLYPFSQQTYN
jgi:hypothetical protein